MPTADAHETPNGPEELDPDRSKHHFVDVERAPAPGYSDRFCLLQAVCTCGWRSGDHLINLDAATDWGEVYARHQCENAGFAHIRWLAAQPGRR